MKFPEQSIHDAVVRQQKSIEAEASESGCSIVDVININSVSISPGDIVSGIMKDIFGGNPSILFVQLFKMKTASKNFLFFQPYDGLIALPGEFHVFLNGSLPDTIIYRESALLGVRKWKSKNRPDLEKKFKADRTIKAVSKRVKWSWESGFSRIDLKWTIQIRPAGGEKLHLVMRNGRYGGFSTYRIGINVFQTLCDAISEISDKYDFPAEAAFIESPVFDGVFKFTHSNKNFDTGKKGVDI